MKPATRGCSAARSALRNGVRQICIGCTRVASSEVAWNTTMVPSSKIDAPCARMGLATSLRIRL